MLQLLEPCEHSESPSETKRARPPYLGSSELPSVRWPRCCCRADSHSPAIPELRAHHNKESSAKYKYQIKGRTPTVLSRFFLRFLARSPEPS
ncbi:hypothetical protein FJTKL_03559 [Diaporthe vaccinii]|uniref:Uncharacterized protein n=1 Tax=Diaporthe vaccinii TaxID=105482 RepID=A0ABR4DV15_9PEZI